MQTYGIFYNPTAGNGAGPANAAVVKRGLEQNGIRGQMLNAPTKAAASALLARAVHRIDALVVLGGDGTLNTAVSAMISEHCPIPLGIIPSGTINNFASHLQIPLDVNAATELMLNGKRDTVDIAAIDDRQAVVSSLTFGRLADIANDVRQQDKQRFGKLAYIGTALRRIGRHRSYNIEYQIDGEKPGAMRTWMALITTTPNIGGKQYTTAAPAHLHLSALHNIGIAQILPYLHFVWTGTIGTTSTGVAYLTPQTVKLRALDNNTIDTRVDGDPGPTLPITVSILPNYLTVLGI
ncbi:diacylglycerol/lipid kinase family protein [Lacticaseibacillus zhaodongensis]|uniref:diacylglycerol/lipid kinase family protein n=1 Tax=Lacticaseibacillus zhaodongensis TaxID=2668065 RepID=UPI0012D2E189|nr:YegS/Rv2252/BmrU family lipid kinase [Lacticaseibacillus zhaodongensis]